MKIGALSKLKNEFNDTGRQDVAEAVRTCYDIEDSIEIALRKMEEEKNKQNSDTEKINTILDEELNDNSNGVIDVSDVQRQSDAFENIVKQVKDRDDER